MTRVLLLHSGYIPHYRVPIYGRLCEYLKGYGFELTVASDRIQADNPHPVEFQYEKMALSVCSIARLIWKRRIDVIILFVDMRHRYLFPTYLIAKGILRRRMIYWGQGLNLGNPRAIRNLAYRAEHALSDAIILYAEHLKKYLSQRFHKKVFIANNTLRIHYPTSPIKERERVLSEYRIRTKKNIICVGRIQKRKRLEQLYAAHARMNRPDVGLILVGPDPDGLLNGMERDNVYRLGSLYGDKKFELLFAADLYCLPGAVGLSIVDAFHCGLPFVTEEGDESAEMMYLKNGVNGFIVPRGDVREMADKLMLLLDNDALRRQFSESAKREIAENGQVDRLCAGFRDALQYCMGGSVDGFGRGPHDKPDKPKVFARGVSCDAK